MAETKFGSDFDANEPTGDAEGFSSDLFSMPIAIGDARFQEAPAEPTGGPNVDLAAEIEDAIEVDVASVVLEDEPTMDAEPSDPNAIAEAAFDIEMPILAAGAIPPERVRFAVPLDVMVEGDSDLYRGAVLNLSTTGIACALPLELAPGQRIWVRFKLGLAEDPLSLLCAVVWRRDHDPQHVLYGVQFTSLTDDESQRISGTVRERLEGRAGDWPLPMMPTPEQARPTPRRQQSSWSSAAFGMIGGMGLALVLSALPHVFGAGTQDVDEDLPLPTATIAEAPDAAALPPLSTPVTIGAQGGSEPVVAKAPEPPLPALEAPVPTVAAKAEEAAPVAKTSEPAATKISQVVTKPAPAPAKPASDLLPRKASAGSTEVTLASGSAAAKPHAFWLDNPRRYVVDVPGKRAATTPEPKGALVSKVRVGSYEDKTRYVLEVAANVQDARVEPRGNALVVTLSK